MPRYLINASFPGRTFAVVDHEGFRVKFRRSPDGELTGLIIHQPNGTSAAISSRAFLIWSTRMFRRGNER
jgi:hypothetical protein